MLHPSKAGVVRALKRLGRPSGAFDASRYFRGDHNLGFYNVGTKPMRALAHEIHRANRERWSTDEVVAFADSLITDRYLEVKSVGIEVMARYRSAFTPRLLRVWKRWLARHHSANWATTDAICGSLIGPLLVQHPALAEQMRGWSRDRNMWVRRASIVGLIPLARKGDALDILVTEDGSVHEFTAPRIDTRNTHGSGCTYAAAITAELAKGAALTDAVASAKRYVTEAIRSNPRLGHGRGPLNHHA